MVEWGVHDLSSVVNGALAIFIELRVRTWQIVVCWSWYPGLGIMFLPPCACTVVDGWHRLKFRC